MSAARAAGTGASDFPYCRRPGYPSRTTERPCREFRPFGTPTTHYGRPNDSKRPLPTLRLLRQRNRAVRDDRRRRPNYVVRRLWRPSVDQAKGAGPHPNIGERPLPALWVCTTGPGCIAGTEAFSPQFFPDAEGGTISELTYSHSETAEL